MGRRKNLSPEPFEIRIDALLENGRGTGEHADRRLEVHGALPGEAVMARYLFGRRMRGQAQTLEVLEPSQYRVAPRCPHVGVCSACSLQHLAPAAQIDFKQDVLLGHFRKHADLEPERLLKPLQADAWNYRRKARLSVRWVRAKGRVLVGFRERDGRFVADIGECHILPVTISERLPDLAALVGSLEGVASIPQIEITCGDDGCALVFRHLESLSATDTEKLRAFARETGLAVLLQPKGPDTVTALEPLDPELGYALPAFGLQYHFQPQDFVQVNASLNQAMITQALDLLELEQGDRVLDLFCGLGNFTLPLAQRCASATGVEADAGLVQRARDNARRNNVRNVSFVQADLYGEEPGTLLPQEAFDKILLDPPRSGAGPVLSVIGASGAQRVVYVACNPVTLAQDAGVLVGQHGYTLKAAGVMDMFPHTAHVESMAWFERN
jgi:23S rRNA (uracil1939-C5)-methyltransferase